MDSNLVACVIGAGNIGKHHATSLIEKGFSVIVVDPIKPEIDGIKWFKEISEEIIHKSNFIIISTTARYHFEIVKKISKDIRKKIVVIEKPLFTNNFEYAQFKSIDLKSDHRFYCNLPNYHNDRIKKLSIMNGLGKINSYTVTGSSWGMACNILHDISILNIFFKNKDFKLSKLNSKIYSFEESKRKGYFEVFGSIDFLFNNIPVNLNCIKDGSLSKNIKVEFENGSVLIDLFSEKMKILVKNEPVKIYEFPAIRASETTGLVAESLINGIEMLPYAASYIDASLSIYEAFAKVLDSKASNKLDYPFT